MSAKFVHQQDGNIYKTKTIEFLFWPTIDNNERSPISNDKWEFRVEDEIYIYEF